MTHYHIQWIHWGNSKLDWEGFKTEEEAKAEAERLKRPDETYAIQKHNVDCRHCAKLRSNPLVRDEC